MPGLGALILVVGPSGAGKDTLLAGAMERLTGTGRFQLARRVITRPADAGSENHIEMDEAAFRTAEANGEFLLSWRAHGLCYGIPRDPYAKLREDGVAVIANVSRGVIGEARARLQPVAVVSVAASPAVLAARLAARGREDAADIEARLARADALDVGGHDVSTVMNDGALDVGVAAMAAALEGASTAEWNPAE